MNDQPSTYNLASPYWGIQKPEMFPPQIVDEMISGRRYVDLTAGGGGMVFNLADKVATHGNDRNAYAAAAFQSAEIIQKQARTGSPSHWYDMIIRQALPSVQRDFSTYYMCDHRDSDFVPTIPLSTLRYIDELCSMQYGGVPAYIACRVLLQDASTRAKSWDVKLNDDFTPMHFYDRFADELRMFMSAVLRIPFRVSGTNLPAEEASALAVLSGDVCYSDPAWPWDPNIDSDKYKVENTNTWENPYTFLTCAVGSILRQEEVKSDTVGFWEADEQVIYKDVVGWIKNCFNSGADKYILSTQDTNWPPPDDVYDAVSASLGIEPTVTKTTAYSVRSHTPYTDCFGVFEAS